MYLCMYVCIYVCMYLCMHVCIYVCTNMYRCMHVRMYVYNIYIPEDAIWFGTQILLLVNERCNFPFGQQRFCPVNKYVCF
jgi:hypothetical protein